MNMNCAANFAFFLVCVVLAASTETTEQEQGIEDFATQKIGSDTENFTEHVVNINLDSTHGTSFEKCAEEAAWMSYANDAIEEIEKAKQIMSSLKQTLDVADGKIARAKLNFPPCDDTTPEGSNPSSDIRRNLPKQIRDCGDWFRLGYNESGVYHISLTNGVLVNQTFPVFCDMEKHGGGWTVIQRRGDFGHMKNYFYRDWKSFKEGFGDLEEEFWLGNDKISALTIEGHWSARFDLQSFRNERKFARYDEFWVDDEDSKYTLHIAGYSGNAGDSMSPHSYAMFSTKDQDNDEAEIERKAMYDANFPNRERTKNGMGAGNLAVWYAGGWWFRRDTKANLNGQQKISSPSRMGIFWDGAGERLAGAQIAIRRRRLSPI